MTGPDVAEAVSQSARQWMTRTAWCATVLICSALAAAGALNAQALSPAWVELGAGEQMITRIVVTDIADCPALIADGKNIPMVPRLPLPPGLRVVCQATIPSGTKSASVSGQPLPLPTTNLKRVIIIGDTGCRIKDQRVQNCNDPNEWPFLQIAGVAAQDHADLVIHAGDFLYRESPCPPASQKECGGTPIGDNWDAWNADFFTPAAKLLMAAPWVFTRGNHESCERSWRGWFYYLDPRDWTGTCEQYSKPYVIKAGTLELAMFDSSEADEDLDAPQASIYAAQLESLHLENAWLVTHIPFWGFKAGQGSGPAVALSASLEDAWNIAAPKGIGMIVSGHIHLFEFITLSGGRPPQLVAGDRGTQLAVPIGSPAVGALFRGSEVTGSESEQKWGYMLLVREKDLWNLTLQNDQHQALVSCKSLGFSSTCEPSGTP
jgi:hypothetical protein